MEQVETVNRPQRRSPYQRNRRLQGEYLSWLLIGMVGVFVALGFLWKDQEFSETENRKLAAFPKFSLSAAADGSFLQGLGDYVADQFPGRDIWVTLNFRLNKLLGQKESSGVYLGEDDYLIQNPGEPNETQLKRNLEAVSLFGSTYSGVNAVMSVVPNSATVNAEKLPANAPTRDQRADLLRIASNLHDVTFIDVTDTLMAHTDEDLYYRTDHHWTSLGAYYAFTRIAPIFGIRVPELEEYQRYTVSETFEGTLASKSGSHSARDTIEIFVPFTSVMYYVTYNNEQSNPVCTLYDRTALSKKDHYTVFFGGNYSRVDITTSADTERNLLIFKDSYANCMVQFLYPYFDHITIIDPRYFYDDVETIMRSDGITDVLFLYNLDTFLSDTSLADVLAMGN